jgi:DNA-binding MarR family transcriptional regulator
MNIPDTWTAALTRAKFGPPSVIRQFLRRAIEVSPEVVRCDGGQFVAAREACLIYALLRSPNHSADLLKLQALTSMDAGAISFVSGGLSIKGLVEVDRDASGKVATLTDLGRELTQRVAQQS